MRLFGVGADNFLTLSAIWNIHRDYEPSFRDFLSRIPHGGTLLDVGANIGITCAIAKAQRPDLSIIAFEPVPRSIRVLKRIKLLHSIKRLRIQPCAISDREAIVTMTVPLTNGVIDTGRSHVVWEQYRNVEVQALAPHQTIEVQLRPLDSFGFDRVDAIKIDVEGHEYQVLNGAKNLLSSFRPLVFCEMWESSNRGRTVNLMSSLGFHSTQQGRDDFLFLPAGREVPSARHIFLA